MARGLFISENFVKENSEIDENVDMKLINPTIWYCQKLYIEPALGTALYNDLIADVVAGSVTGDNLTLVDPKGIRNMNHDDTKIEFYKEIKNIETKLEHSDLTLNSFILSITPMKDILNNSLSEEEFAEKNVLFMVGNGTA